MQVVDSTFETVGWYFVDILADGGSGRLIQQYSGWPAQWTFISGNLSIHIDCFC